MKGLATAQWINVNWNNRSVLVIFYIVRIDWPILQLLVGLMASRQAVREVSQQKKYDWGSKFLKFSMGYTIWTFILFNITAMQLQH